MNVTVTQCYFFLNHQFITWGIIAGHSSYFHNYIQKKQTNMKKKKKRKKARRKREREEEQLENKKETKRIELAIRSTHASGISIV